MDVDFPLPFLYLRFSSFLLTSLPDFYNIYEQRRLLDFPLAVHHD